MLLYEPDSLFYWTNRRVVSDRRGFLKTPKRGEPWKLRTSETTDDTTNVNWLERRRGEMQMSLWR